MPTESTKRAIQQLRDAGYENLATHLRDTVLELEALGGTAGIGFIATGAGGAGSASVTFSPAFTAVPTFSTSVDNQYPVTIGGLTTTGCTVSITGAPANSYVYFSYQAQGH